MAFTIYSANCRGNQKNCLYPIKHDITDAHTLRDAVSVDYVPCAYTNSYRETNNFVRADLLGMDIDNDHSEDPSEWIDVRAMREAFPDVAMLIHYSRNHEKQKGDRSPRPRFHVLFAIDECRDAAQYAEMKRRLYGVFPFFDSKALDAARLFFGTEEPQVEILDGKKNLNDFFAEMDAEDAALEDFLSSKAPNADFTIHEGSRNATLSHFAGRILKRLGDTQYAHEQFLRRAESCEPPLVDDELATIWHSAQKFYARVCAESGYIQPEHYRVSAEGLRPLNYTDVDEARVFADEYRMCVRHSTATEFIVYDGTVWVESEARAHGMLHTLTDRQLEEHAPVHEAAKQEVCEAEEALDKLKMAGSGVDKPMKTRAERAVKNAERKLRFEESYHKFLLKCRNSGRISGVLEEAKTLLEIDVAELDADPFLLNTPGGEVDLRTGMLMPHDPTHYHTRITAVAPSQEGMTTWMDFLKLITCGDGELMEYLQITSGEELVGRIFNENMRIKVGQGSNGKSTYTNTKLRVIGSYGGQISAETLTTGNRSGKNWEIAELRGKRLVVASELEEGMRLNTSFVKKICSTDMILGEKKHKDPFTFLPSHTVVLYTNHLPKVGSIDKGTWRRLTVIPFLATIQGDSDIKNYTEHLFAHCGGAVLKWMVEGARKFIGANYHIRVPSCVQEAVEAYRTESDWVTAFLEECCVMKETYSIRGGDLYRIYRTYCDSIGEFKRSPQEFKAAITSFGFHQRKTRLGSFYYGLREKTDEIPSEDARDFWM